LVGCMILQTDYWFPCSDSSSFNETSFSVWGVDYEDIDEL
jgi:hypothetical protein